MEGGKEPRRKEDASALSGPFGRSRGPSGSLSGRAPHHDHARGRGRLTTCESRHSGVWCSLSFLSCVHLVRAHITLKSHIIAEKSPKLRLTYCSAHHSFRTLHAALEQHAWCWKKSLVNARHQRSSKRLRHPHLPHISRVSTVCATVKSRCKQESTTCHSRPVAQSFT